MKILLIGANSYVGARLYFDLRSTFEVIGTYNNIKLSNTFIQLDITNEKRVDEIINFYQPEVIIHVVANPSSKWCEANPKEAILLNEKATSYIVNSANKIKAKIIYISSFAAINPSKLYGKTKLNSEQIVKNTVASWIILRPSLIVGFSPNTINDRPFNRFLKNLDEETPAVYDNSWKFQPTYIGHISEIIKEIINRNINNEIIPISVSGFYSRYDLAKDILTPFGIVVSAVNENDQAPEEENDQSKLKELKLKTYTYEEMVNKINEEIKNRNIYKI